MDMFKIINDTMTMLRIDEGERLFPYTDSLGYLTIGVGRCLDKNGIRKSESTKMLENDTSEALASCIEKIPFFRDLDSVRQSVLVNMAFNLGINGLLKFKNMLSALGSGDYKEAGRQMIDSNWHKQVGNRALRLEFMMVYGTIAEEYKK